MSKFSKQFNVWHVANDKKYRTATLYRKALCKKFRNWKSPEDYSELSQEVRALKIENEKLKADKQLVVVPELTQKQAETLNDYKNGSNSLLDYLRVEVKKKDYGKFAHAWLDGYTIKKEQLYEVVINGLYLAKLMKCDDSKRHIFIEKDELVYWQETGYRLTSKQIKMIDKRYMAFAVKVDEV